MLTVLRGSSSRSTSVDTQSASLPPDSDEEEDRDESEVHLAAKSNAHSTTKTKARIMTRHQVLTQPSTSHVPIPTQDTQSQPAMSRQSSMSSVDINPAMHAPVAKSIKADPLMYIRNIGREVKAELDAVPKVHRCSWPVTFLTVRFTG